MKSLFFICILFFFGLEGFAIDKKVPSAVIDSIEKAKATIDSIKAFNPDKVKKVHVCNDDTLVFDDLEAPKVKDNDGDYVINNQETKANIAMIAPTNDNKQAEKMDNNTLPFQADFGKIFPNPANAHALINIDLKKEGDKFVLLRSANGEINRTFSTTDNHLNIVDLSSGIYFLQISHNGQYKTQRLYVK